MTTQRILAGIALILVLVSFLPQASDVPLLAVAVILLAIAILVE